MTLKRGDRGDAVKRLQQALISAGFDVGIAGVDGIFGADTERAVQEFQQSNGLDENGIVDVNTLNALDLDLRGDLNWAAIKQEIVSVVQHEFEVVWDRGRKKEHESDMRPVLLDYYDRGVGMNRQDILDELHQQVKERAEGFDRLPLQLEALALKEPKDLSESEEDNLLSQVWFTKVPWSAVFISWVMQKAGAGTQFRSARAHWRYVKAAKEISDANNPIQAFEIDAVVPEPGDILVTGRANSAKTNKKATWNSFENTLTHGDIVVEVRAGELVGIGGNVSNSVKDTPIDLNADGLVRSSGGQDDWDHFAVVRIVTS